jgi:hypothetical protein
MEFIDRIVDTLRSVGVRAQRSGADRSEHGGSLRYVEVWIDGERHVWHMLSPAISETVDRLSR